MTCIVQSRNMNWKGNVNKPVHVEFFSSSFYELYIIRKLQLTPIHGLFKGNRRAKAKRKTELYKLPPSPNRNGPLPHTGAGYELTQQQIQRIKSSI